MQKSNQLASTVAVACQRLSVKRTCFYKLVKRGEIKTIKAGGRTLVPESELQAFIDNQIGGAH